MTKILITGGTGMVGTRLSALLRAAGHNITHLSRNPGKSKIKAYAWDPARKTIDPACLEGVDAIVHLAGSPIAKRWSKAYKQEILDSRIESTRLLSDALHKHPHQVKAFVSASAIGIYGTRVQGPADENYPPANDFLADVCKRWEQETSRIKDFGIRTAMIRTGIVLSENGGMIPAIARPAKLFLGAPIGNGKMMVSWIHMDDLCGIYQKAALDIQMQGSYNAVAPNPVTNRELTREICNALKRPMWPIPVPAFLLKLAFGELAEVILADQQISAKKIIDAGYQFKFADANTAIRDLLK